MRSPTPTQSAQSGLHIPSMFGSANGVTYDSTRGKRKTISSEQLNAVVSLLNVHAQDVADSFVVKIFYAHAIPFHVAHSLSNKCSKM